MRGGKGGIVLIHVDKNRKTEEGRKEGWTPPCCVGGGAFPTLVEGEKKAQEGHEDEKKKERKKAKISHQLS